MTEKVFENGWLDINQHIINRAAAFPPEEMAKYEGQEVAFSADGTKILAHGADFLQLWAELERAGINPRECVWDFVLPEDKEYL